MTQHQVPPVGLNATSKNSPKANHVYIQRRMMRKRTTEGTRRMRFARHGPAKRWIRAPEWPSLPGARPDAFCTSRGRNRSGGRTNASSTSCLASSATGNRSEPTSFQRAPAHSKDKFGFDRKILKFGWKWMKMRNRAEPQVIRCADWEAIGSIPAMKRANVPLCLPKCQGAPNGQRMNLRMARKPSVACTRKRWRPARNNRCTPVAVWAKIRTATTPCGSCTCCT